MKSEPYSIRPLAPLHPLAWELLCAFSDQVLHTESQKMIKQFQQVAATKPLDTKTWWMALDYCRLLRLPELGELTTLYAQTFSKPPPEWAASETDPTAKAGSQKGGVLNLLSVSAPESEQYGAVLQNVKTEKSALLLKAHPGRALSWQPLAVQRLAEGVQQLRKSNIPVYVEHPDVLYKQIESVPVDQRTDHDWSLLFFLLLCLKNEGLFEKEAEKYMMVKGMSPPSYEPLNYPDPSEWFDALEGSSEGDKPSGEGSLKLQGMLSTAMGSLTQQVTSRLQKSPAIVLDLQQLTHADWTSLFELGHLTRRVWNSGSREMFLTEPRGILLPVMLDYIELPPNALRRDEDSPWLQLQQEKTAQSAPPVVRSQRRTFG